MLKHTENKSDFGTNNFLFKKVQHLLLPKISETSQYSDKISNYKYENLKSENHNIKIIKQEQNRSVSNRRKPKKNNKKKSSGNNNIKNQENRGNTLKNQNKFLKYSQYTSDLGKKRTFKPHIKTNSDKKNKKDDELDENPEIEEIPLTTIERKHQKMLKIYTQNSESLKKEKTFKSLKELSKKVKLYNNRQANSHN